MMVMRLSPSVVDGYAGGRMASIVQDQPTVFTIGHSNHSSERFLALLRGSGITAIADVRSIPRSRRWPQFSRGRIERWLADAGIAYVFLGAELGGRPGDPALLRDGHPDYELMSATPSFHAGLDRVLDGASRYRIALMCAEREPLDCHRFLLVSRRLHERGVDLCHILADGSIEPQRTTERRLLQQTGVAVGSLFADLPPPRHAIATAYDVRSGKIGRGRQPIGPA
jgi:uncharacterized protein (DUF488 family)